MPMKMPKTKFALFGTIAVAVLVAVNPTVSLAQVEVGPGGVSVGPHHDRDHAPAHGADVHVDTDHATHGTGHGDAVTVQSGHSDHSDHGNDHTPHTGDHHDDKR